MRSSVLKPTIFISVVFLLALAGCASFLVLVSADDYRAQIIDAVQKKTGATVVLAEPLHWQLWPLGIKLGKISLHDENEPTPLLEALAAAIGIQPLSILTGSPRISILALDGANIGIDRKPDGSSNWDAVLKRVSGQASDGIRQILLSNGSVMLMDQGSRRPDEILIKTLSLSDIDSAGEMPLAATFTFNRRSEGSVNDHGEGIPTQNIQGQNFLSQNIVTATILRNGQNKAVEIKDLNLDAEVSSTLFPGNFNISLLGDFSKNGPVFSSKNAGVTLAYKNLTMADPLRASLKSTVLANFNDKTLALNALQFAVLGNANNTTKASGNISSNWVKGEVNASQLKISTQLDNPLTGNVLPLQFGSTVVLKWLQGDISLSDISINAGGVIAEGRLQASVPALHRGMMQTQSLLQGMTVQGNLKSESLDLAALLAALGMGDGDVKKTNISAIKPARFQTDFELADAKLVLRNLQLVQDKTTVHSELTISALNASPVYRLMAALDSDDISPLSHLFAGQDLSGKAKAMIDLSVQGESFEDLVKSARGEGSIKLENSRLQGANMMANLLKRLGSYGSLLPGLAADAGKNAVGNYTDIVTLSASGSVDKGVVMTKAFAVDFGKAAIKGSGSYDQVNQIMNYSATMNLDKSLFLDRTKSLQVPMQCQGNLAEEQLGFIEALGADCKTDTKAMNDMIAQTLIKRFNGR